MSDVIDFTKAAEEIEPLVWGCLCGNYSFLVYDNGLLECAECETIQSESPHKQTIRKWTRVQDNEV